MEVVIVGLGEDFDRIADLLAELGVKRPIVLADRYGKVGARYQVRFLPTTFLISREGRIREVIRGELPDFQRIIREKAAALSLEDSFPEGAEP
jgi:hypothetical protein